MLKLIGSKIKNISMKKILISVFALFALGALAYPFLSIPKAKTAALQAAQPNIYPYGGSVLTQSAITLSSATAGAAIYYTINGATPTTSSYLYSGSVDLQPGASYFYAGTYTVKLADSNAYHIDITSYVMEIAGGGRDNFGLVGTAELLGNDNLRLPEGLGSNLRNEARIMVIYK